MRKKGHLEEPGAKGEKLTAILPLKLLVLHLLAVRKNGRDPSKIGRFGFQKLGQKLAVLVEFQGTGSRRRRVSRDNCGCTPNVRVSFMVLNAGVL